MRLDTSIGTLRTSHRHLSKTFTPNSMVRAAPLCWQSHEYQNKSYWALQQSSSHGCHVHVWHLESREEVVNTATGQTEGVQLHHHLGAPVHGKNNFHGGRAVLVSLRLCRAGGGQRSTLGHPCSHPARGLLCEGKGQHRTQLCSPVFCLGRVRDRDTNLRNSVIHTL